MIQRILLLLFCLFTFSQIQAQAPTYDDCDMAVQLGIAPFGTCTTTEYTNVNATLTSIFSNAANNIPSCWSSVDHDVWFEFTVPADGSHVDFEITVASGGTNPIGQFKAALYRGECMIDDLQELGCAVAAPGDTEIKFDAMFTSGLTPGISYFIRVDDQSSTATPDWGTFNVCVDSLPDINLMCDAAGSTANSGILYDSGGPDNDYSNGENCSFSICPTTPPGCIILSVNYNTEEGFDFLTVHDGNNANAPILGQALDAGGSCYTLHASSGCATVDWNSDYIINTPGFEVSWTTTTTACPTYSPPNLTTSPTENLIIEKLGAVPNSISNLTVNCGADAHGAFDGTDNSLLFMNEGMVLTTGSASYAFTPNDTNVDSNVSNNNNSDNDLIALANQLTGFQPELEDACVLEMDVIAAGTDFSLEYIFGSDEYLGNGFGGFSNVVGIWISGPGIVGDPAFNNQELLSVLPGTNTPIHYSNVNSQVNFEYFRFNGETDLGPRYNGFTTDVSSSNKKTLTAMATVEQCSTYHLKIAIAENDIPFFPGSDSGIFFGDLDVGLPQTVLSGMTSFENLVEGCTNNDVLDLNLSNPLGENLDLEVQISGTATQGVDYTLTIPNNITFTAGQTNMNFPITILNDGMMEGTEIIEIKFVYDFGCGEFDFATIVVEIEDMPNLSAANDVDTVFVCTGESVHLMAEGAQTYSWSPTGALDNPNIANPIATPTTSETYTVTGTLGSCMLTDEVFVQIISPSVNVIANNPTNVCEGTGVQLTANSNVGNMEISWSPIVGLDDPTSATPTATPPQTITYTATVSISGCSASDQITINVDPFDFPNLTTTDTVLCEGDSLVLAAATPGSGTNYVWTPNTEILNPNNSNAIVFPTNNTTYTLTATSPNAFCSQTADVNIEVVPASLEIQGGNFYELCLGETVDLIALTSTNGVGFSWSPDSSLTSGTATTVTASPTLSTDYIAKLEVGGCTLTELVTVKVDSLPEINIQRISEKDTYCIDEEISFISFNDPPIDFGFYPDIQFAWTPNDASLLSSPDNLNLAIRATNSQTYTLNVNNGSCSYTENVAIEVIDVNVDLNTSDVALCVGETLDLVASGATNYTWNTSNNLSCSDCPNPTLTASASGQVVVIGETDGCMDSESINVALNESPTNCSADAAEAAVAVGEMVEVFANYESTNSVVTIEWTKDGATIGQGDSTFVNVIQQGDNIYTATITNSEGCSCTADVMIRGVKPNLKMPNAFTPDGDGVNDFFDILFIAEETSNVVDRGAIEILDFTIFNRWGNVVYENDTPTAGWDGTIDGKNAPSEVYVYFVELKYPDGTTEIAKGDVTLIR